MKNNGVGRLIWNTLVGILIAVGGILIIANQEAFVKVVMVIAGIFAILVGIYTLVNLFKWQFQGPTKVLAICKGVLTIVLGAFAVYSPFATGAALFTTFIYIFAIGLVVSAVVAVQNAYALHKLNAALPVSGFAWEALIDVIIAILCFINPTEIMGIAVTVIGVIAILLGAVTVFTGFRVYRKIKD